MLLLLFALNFGFLFSFSLPPFLSRSASPFVCRLFNAVTHHPSCHQPGLYYYINFQFLFFLFHHPPLLLFYYCAQRCQSTKHNNGCNDSFFLFFHFSLSLNENLCIISNSFFFSISLNEIKIDYYFYLRKFHYFARLTVQVTLQSSRLIHIQTLFTFHNNKSSSIQFRVRLIFHQCGKTILNPFIRS